MKEMNRFPVDFIRTLKNFRLVDEMLQDVPDERLKEVR